MAKRFFDISLALFFAFVLILPIIVIYILVKLTSKGPGFYLSQRVGRNNINFSMPKFRTMKIETPAVATHLLDSPKSYLTPIGGFLRMVSLDELPQIWNILIGNMSFVGPRPALYNQNDLIELRTKKCIHELTPGLTGWAQINGRDNISIEKKVDLDYYYYKNKSFWLDIKILFYTCFKVFSRDDISH